MFSYIQKLILTLFFLTLHSNLYSKENTIFVKVMFSSGNQRSVFVNIIKKYNQENKSIKVVLTEYEQEDYKSRFPEFIKNKDGKSDILFWFGGNDLKDYINNGYVESLSNEVLKGFSTASKVAVEFNNQYYALPVSYYQWGFYYNQSVFDELNLKPPQTFSELLKLCEVIKNHGIIPILLSSKSAWPVAGWFDYLNLRINGLEFHKNLLSGKYKYSDKKVETVFKTWSKLFEYKCFNANSNQYEWRQVLPLLYRGVGTMYLMGNFIEPKIPFGIKTKIKFFKFPVIDENVPLYEEAPLDVFLITKTSRHKKEALNFIEYLSQSEVLDELNSSMGMISPHINAVENLSYFISSGRKTLLEAKGISHFYDRDQPRKKAEIGMSGFLKFIQNPYSYSNILKEIDAQMNEINKTDKPE